MTETKAKRKCDVCGKESNELEFIEAIYVCPDCQEKVARMHGLFKDLGMIK